MFKLSTWYKRPRVSYNIAKEIFDELQGLTNTTLISSGSSVKVVTQTHR